MSLFISFEGGEGCGKTTQIENLCQRFKDANVQALFIKEPGTTQLGLHLRGLIKGKPWGNEAISPRAELFLFAAARAELVTKVLKPVLKQRKNIVVVADRYVDSTTAYQGYGRRLPISQVKAINSLATQGVMPDITFLLDCPPDEGLKRVGSLQTEFALEASGDSGGGRMDEEDTRRFEEEPLDFHERVRSGYLKLAEAEPDRWRVIDATKSIEDISEMIWKHVQEKLPGELAEDTDNLMLESPSSKKPRTSRRSRRQ
ncbi:MAG: dTMP kinase [Chloroflexi bacterium]|nr:dTMP kinase [Chloroflexota bacterium]